MFDLLKSRAEREGKSVSVTNGILVVDDVPVFSLKGGKISNNAILLWGHIIAGA